MPLQGILVAMPTPLTPEGELDLAAIDPLCDFLVDAGVSGVIPCGSTGEFATLTQAERMTVTEAVAAAVAGRVALTPHVGSLRPGDAEELMRHAAELGAAAAMAVPPFYGALSQAEYLAYHAGLADAAPELPIMAYNHPGAGDEGAGVAELEALIEAVPSVRYLKDSSGDAALIAELLAHFDDDWLRVFNGADSLTFQNLAVGAHGSVWGAASFAPQLAVALFDALYRDLDLAEGRRLWALMRPICQLLEGSNYVAAVKAACELVGAPVGPPRRPALPLAAPVLEDLRALLDRAGLLGAAAPA
jgi:dihydrodipicolinate synthase/N-acetylneuraminate lyase